MKRIISTSLLLLLALATVSAQAPMQTYEDLRILLDGWSLTTNGAELPAKVMRSTSVVKIGQVTSAVYSMRGCGYFSVQPGGNPFANDAAVGWRLDVTPTRVAGKAVTFRLKWTRTPGINSKAEPANEDIEVTLKPGESRLVDSVTVAPGSKTFDDKPCAVKTAGLRVSVEYPYFDPRLIGADVWLVQKLPNGREQSQLQAIRGVPYRPMSFYFESIPDGAERFDFFGTLQAELNQGGVAINLEGVRAAGEPGKDYHAARWFRSELQLKPDEIIEVALPKIEEQIEKTSLKGHVFSLRIRAKRLR